MRSVQPVLQIVALLGAALAGSGCAVSALTPLRNPVPPGLVSQTSVPGMSAVRIWGDEVPRDFVAEMRTRLPNMARFAESGVRKNGRPVVNYLALSGGGADGAFGAGLLAGWSAAGTRPNFQVVTGVSAGAIIAPLAFLGSDYDGQLREIWTKYKTDDIIQADLLSGLFGGSALGNSAPLAGLIARYVDRRLLEAVAREYRNGRLLLIGTTNLDAERFVIWNMGEIAASGQPHALDLFRQVILASASIPGAFPPVSIKVTAEGRPYDEMHADGGVTKGAFIAPVQLSLREFDRFYSTPPLRRLYIIQNSRLEPDANPVKPKVVSIAKQSVETLVRSRGLADLFQICAMARRDSADFNLAAIPGDFKEQPKEVFDRAYMQGLYQRGFELGRSGSFWMKAPPERMEAAERC